MVSHMDGARRLIVLCQLSFVPMGRTGENRVLLKRLLMLFRLHFQAISSTRTRRAWLRRANAGSRYHVMSGQIQSIGAIRQCNFWSGSKSIQRI